jgi:hypothetical protein
MVEVSGRAAEAARFVLWEHDPAHQVARLDICRDVLAPGQFVHYSEVLQDLADQRGIKYRRLYHDPRDPAAGGTLYVGSPDSEARDVLYDKHAQDPSYDPGTLRFEHRLRPKTKARKRRTADLPPSTAFRLGCIGSDIAAILDDKDLPAARLPAQVEKTAAESIEYMLHSYRRKLQMLAAEIGTEAVLPFIAARLAEALGPIADPTGPRTPAAAGRHAVPNPEGAAPSSGAGDMAAASLRRTGTEPAELVQSRP